MLTQSSYSRVLKNKKVAYNLLFTCFTFVLLTLFGCLQKHKDNLSRLFKKKCTVINKTYKKNHETGTSIWLHGKKINFWSMKPSLGPSLPDIPKLKLKNHHLGNLVSEKSKLKILGIVFLVNLKWWRIATVLDCKHRLYLECTSIVQRKSVSATCCLHRFDSDTFMGKLMSS